MLLLLFLLHFINLLSKDFRNRCCKLMGFLVTKDGFCLLASRSVLAVLKNYRKEWYVTSREQVYDTLNTEVSEFVQLGIPEWGKFPLLKAYIELSLLDFLFPLCKYTKQIQEQGWSVPLISLPNCKVLRSHSPATLTQPHVLSRQLYFVSKTCVFPFALSILCAEEWHQSG